MKIVYIAHPLIGGGLCDPEFNYSKISDIARKITFEEEGTMPLSPVHAFSFLPWFDEECDARARKLCMHLMSTADEVRVFGDWQSSGGCLAEIERARELGLRIVYEDGQVEEARSEEAEDHES